MAGACAPGALAQSEPQLTTPHERPPAHPWMPRPTVAPAGTVTHCGPWERDGFRSIQVNVDARGCNIVGDAANEPSIAVDPTDPRKIVIGWRQFDSVLSDFRQAGWGYSHDGGHTWVFRGSLDPGVFGSDPVLAAGLNGHIYYLSINFDETRVFRSLDAGITFRSRTQLVPYLYDKPWMVVDMTDGIGRGNIYITSATIYNRFFRSLDDGASFTEYALGRNSETLTVAPDGAVYLALGGGGAGNEWDLTRSDNAANRSGVPSAATEAALCLSCLVGQSNLPNPGGLLGQLWVGAHRAGADSRRLVFLLGGVGLDPANIDLVDVAFMRSNDGGVTWDRPVVVNDDPPRRGSWQWFAMMSVAPNGRIDAVWNDTRNSGQANLSELFYSYSTDAGETWSKNIPISPIFDSWVGWPQQAKLGDYYHMVSDNLGVNVAYAATFNGEQDIYFLRIGPWDCNGNEIDDALDISEARSRDCNANGLPDECEYRADANGDGLTTLSDFAAFQRALAGPEGTLTGGCTELLDPDHDGDVDLHDFYTLQSVFAP